MRLRFVSLVLLFLCACAGRKAALHPGSLKPTAEEQAHGATVLLDEAVVHFRPDADGKAVVETRALVRTLYLQKFAERPRTLRHGYSRTFERPPELRAAIIAPDGSLAEADQEAISDEPVDFSSILYQDTRARVLPLREIPDGAILETESVSVQREPRLFQQYFMFGGSHPTRKARWVLRHPASWKIEAIFMQGKLAAEVTERLERDGDDVLHIYEFDDRPPAVAEDRGIWGQNLITGHARLLRWTEGGKEHSAFANDEELSRFQAELNAGTDEATVALKAEVKQIVAGAADEAEKARRLHAHVATSIRYCAVELGLGGWRPHTAAEVLQARAGDCKDKANLLKTMLKAAGIESRLAALYAHGGHPRVETLPTLGTTNHAILIVDLPSGPVPVDPTSDATPFGELPPQDEGALLLPVQAGGAKGFHTEISPAEKNRVETSFTARLLPSGIATGALQLRVTGAPAASLRDKLYGSTPARREEVLDDFLPLRTTTRRDLALEGLRIPASEVTLKADAEVELLQGTGRARVLRLSHAADVEWPVLKPGKRSTPFALWYRRSGKTTLRVELPPGTTVRLPPPVKLESAFGRYEASWQLQDGVLTVEREARLDKRVIDSGEFEAFRAFIEKARGVEAHPVVVMLGAVAP